MSATATIAVCVLLTTIVFVIDTWSIRRMRDAILQAPVHDPMHDPMRHPLDPDIQ